MPSPRRLFGLVFCAVLVAASVAAEPITILSGTLQTSGFGRRTSEVGVSFDLIGEGGFSASGGEGEDVFDAAAVSCHSVNPCAAGASVLTGADLFVGGAFFGGSRFILTGERVTIPLDAGDQVQVQSPFTLTGTLTIARFTSDGRRIPGTPVELSGAGTATTFLLRGPGGFVATSRSFEFESASATPEPASLLLLGTGAAMVFRRRVRPRA